MVSIKTTQQGLQDGWTRATFILRNQHLEELKALAYWERKTIKEVIDEALRAYLKGEGIEPTGGRRGERNEKTDCIDGDGVCFDKFWTFLCRGR